MIDPLVPEDAVAELDERVAGRPVVVLTTMRFHGRSRDAVLERYGGAKVRHDAPMPAGVEALPVARFDETMYWLPGPRALVPGDRLIGDGQRRRADLPAVVAGLHRRRRWVSRSCGSRWRRCWSCRSSTCCCRMGRRWWAAGREALARALAV